MKTTTKRAAETVVEIVEANWPRSRGWYVAVLRGDHRGDLWMKTRSSATAARMSAFGFLGTCYEEARMEKIRLKDIPVYP